MTNYLLIDANSVGYAAQDGKKLTIGGEEIQAVYGFIRILQKRLREYPNYRPIILWDGHAQWRYDLYPLYKGHRDDDPVREAERAAYKKQKPKIMEVLTLLGVTQITDPDAEADDLAGYLAPSLSSQRGLSSDRIVLMTGDKDWCQLITKSVSWHCIRTERKCDWKTFEEFTGFKNAQQFVEAKCLVGDDSDNVAGVGGIGKDTVRGFLDKYNSVEEFLKTDPYAKLPVAHARLRDNVAPTKISARYGQLAPAKDAYYRNLKLMSLEGYKPKKSSLKVINEPIDVEGFKAFCEEHLFKSILIQLDSWIIPFQKINNGGAK